MKETDKVGMAGLPIGYRHSTAVPIPTKILQYKTMEEQYLYLYNSIRVVRRQRRSPGGNHH